MLKPEITLPELTAEQEQAVAASYLAKLAEQEPDELPLEIFLPAINLLVANTVEVGFLKPSTEDEENPLILLTQRPTTDRFWANQWHVPGSVVRGIDPIKHEHDYSPAISRVLKEVGGDVQILGEPIEFETVRRRGPRGSETTVMFLARTEGEPENGRYFDTAGIVRRPPEEGLIDGHAATIEKIAAIYNSIRAN